MKVTTPPARDLTRASDSAVTLGIQLSTPALERLLDHNPQARHGGAGLFDDQAQYSDLPLARKSSITSTRSLLVRWRGEIATVLSTFLVKVLPSSTTGFRQGQGLLLAGEDHRHAQVQAGHDRWRDA